MKPFIREGSNSTFKVILDKGTGVFEFEGKSRPENAVGFFDPIFEWLNQYMASPNDETIVVFRLEYFNSSSAKVLLRLLVKLEEYHTQGKNVKIHWQYRENDEDMYDTGEDFSTLVEVPFELIEIP